MRVNPHDAFEALIQAPGEQILELGGEIDRFWESIKSRADVGSALRNELDERLAYFAARMREIEPVVEKLQEIVEDHDLRRQHEDDDEITAPTPFQARQQPPFAAVLLHRLAAARAAGNLTAASELRDVIATYLHGSPIAGVRDALVNGLRLDALAHGETPPGYCVASLAEVRRELLSCVPD